MDNNWTIFGAIDWAAETHAVSVFDSDARTHRTTINHTRDGSLVHPLVGSGHVEAVEVHDLGPGVHEGLGELVLVVVAAVDLRDGAELGVRTEHQVHA